ncbi:HAMP domain-containing methyl-accepting chemotaxis protein [Thaumasiovibrio subtropicus]|uniref:HAMP domain-containing methyl-accepting chemotaxis protein n=1 Tax=Thaumasiovibrio subtropicus TaxID=1891207 RepID=UPI000B35D522|nr:methyl-accepting chemotaxis protein [Thaumasiovibrio subtropicus]
MKVSIVLRTIIGFAIMFLLLVVLGGVSYFNTKNIQQRVDQVTEEATPLLVGSSQLQSTALGSQRRLLEFRTLTNQDKLAATSLLFDEQKAVFSDIAAELVARQTSPDLADEFSALQAEADNYYAVAAEIMALHRELVMVSNNLAEIRSNFVHQEDVYQQASQLLLDATADKRSQRNKVERLTSGISRDLKTLRRANQETDLNALIEDLNRNITNALKNLSRVKASDAVLARFRKAVEELQVSSTSETGLLPQMLSLQAIESNIARLDAQANQHLVAMEALLDSFASSSQSAVEEAKTVTEKSVSSAVLFNITMTLVSGGVAIVIGYMTAQSIHSPLAKITPVLKKMAEGDMTHKVNYQSSCEFGALSASLDALVDGMREVLSQINQGAESLAEEARNAAMISENTMAHVEQQKNQIDQVAAAISEMEVSVTEVFRSSENTQQEVTHANDGTQDGRRQVAINREITESLYGAINQAVEITSKLDEFSANIGSILDVIRGIAEQTNLLALNAAIEAARAGDHGRGFAVVADEVRTLANRTQQSTVEIQTMIENLQQSSKQVSEVMNESQSQTERCVEQSRTTDETLQSVAGRMEAIKEMTVQVAHATEEQISVSKDIAKNINGITEVALETESQARNSASVSDVLAQLAEQQRALAGRFKL